MSPTWPKNRGREDEQEERSRKEQRLRLVCGVDGCRKSFRGRFEDVIRRRDAHRREAHPDFVPPKRRMVSGFGKKRSAA